MTFLDGLSAKGGGMRSPALPQSSKSGSALPRPASRISYTALMLALEPRIMLDGAAAVTALEAVAAAEDTGAAEAKAAEDAKQAETEADALAEAAKEFVPPAERNDQDDAADELLVIDTPTQREIVFVDHRVQDPEVLLRGLDDNLQVVALDAGSDGLGQIAAALKGMQDVAAIHIIAEGNDGELYLGDSRLTNDNLADFAGQLGAIGAALAETGDTLFYGCNLAESDRGKAFIDLYAQLTGADVAASDDRTASTALGGDAELEISTGSVEADSVLTSAALSGYGHSLATITVDVNNDTGAGGTSLREAIAAASAGDTITFAGALAGNTITLTQGQLTLDKQLTIDGDINNDNAFAAAQDITISGGDNSRVFNVTGGSNGSEVELFGVRLQNGLVFGAGGAGSSGATGSAGGAGEGGAIRNSGFLIINQSVITNNHASGGGGGGAATFVAYRGYGGGGGGGFGGSGGGAGGASGNNNNAPTSGGSGTGGRGGYSNIANAVNYAGKGGSTAGGAGGNDGTASGGGGGGTAVINGGNVIGGGGGGYTVNTGTGGAGGLAAGGIFNSGTLSINNTSMTLNAGGGGGGGGGFSGGQASGAGGRGIGGIYNGSGSSFNYNGSLTFGSGATANAGGGGTDGINKSGASAGGDGSSTANTLNVGATVNNNFTLATNSAPTTTNLNGDSFTFTEGDGATAIDQGGNATVADADGGDFSGGNLTVTITSGEVAAEDVLSFDSGTVTLAGTTAGSNVTVGGVVVGTLTNAISAGNDLVVSLNVSSTAASVQTLVRAITYQNTDTDNPTTGARTIRVTVNDGDGGTSANADVTATVAALNDEPTLTATGSNPTFTEGGGAASLFSSSAASTVESGQTLTAMTFTVSNVADGSTAGADEVINFDGTAIALNNSNSGTTSGNSASFSVSLAGGTATVTLTSIGVNDAGMNTLLDAMSYQNNSQDPSTNNRVVTITSLTDSGSNAGSNDNVNSALSVASTATVAALNDEPTLTATGSNPTFTEGGGAASLFSSSAASTVESGQTLTAMTFTVSNVADGSTAGADEVINFDGTAIALNNSNSGTTSGNSASFSVSLSSGTATVTLTSIGVNDAGMNTLLDAMSYQNNSQDPSTNNRVVTITSLTDSGSNTGSNDNVNSTLAVASTATVAAVNDAPTTTDLNGDSFTFTEGDGATVIDQGGNATVADVDSANLSGGNLTVTITSGEDAAEDVLSFDSGTVTLAGTTAGSNVTVGGTVVGTLTNAISAGNDLVVSLNGNSTAANVQTLVRAITYQNTDTVAPTTGARTIRVTVNDGDGGTSSNADVTATVAAVNSVPTTSNLNGDKVAFAEDGTAIIIDQENAAQVADTDSADFNSGNLTVSIAGGTAAQDQLGIKTDSNTTNPTRVTLSNGLNNASVVSVGGTSIGAITAVGGDQVDAGENLVVTFNSGATAARVSALMQQITYRNTTTTSAIDTSARTVSFTVADGDGGTTTAATVTVTPAARNDAGVFTNLDGTPTFQRGGAAVVLDANGTITDEELGLLNSGNGNFDGATLRLQRSGGANSNDAFANSGSLGALTAGGNLVVDSTTIGTVTTNSGGTLLLSFNSSATTALVNSALQKITYSSTAGAETSAQIEYTLTDPTAITPGFVINGVDASDFSGRSVSSAGDVNGDGLADLIVGARDADPNGNTYAGASYVVFGKATAAAVELSAIEAGSGGGFVINGVDANDLSGRSVSGAGDVNGDGLADLIVGAFAADPAGDSSAGASYVVFGKTTATAVELSTIEAGSGGGFVIDGVGAGDYSGFSVSAAGDVNGDGLADLIVGAKNADPNNGNAGASYVVFGKTTATAVALSTLEAAGTVSQTSTGSVTVTINNLPVFTGLDGGATFTEGGAAVTVDGNATVADVELDASNGAAGDWNGATFTVRRSGGAEASDTLAVQTGGGITVVGANIQAGGQTIATVNTATGGQIVITFTNANTAPTTALVQDVLQNITYSNSSDTPPASVTLDVIADDGAGATTGTATVSITDVNDEPTLTATGSNPTFTEGGEAASLFSGAAASTIESGQTLAALTFTVSNVADGASAGADEVVNFDGTAIALNDGNSGTTSGNSASFSVSLAGGTATVTVTSIGVDNAGMNTLLDAMSYQNNSQAPATSNRVVTITSLTDSGLNGGSDDNVNSALSVASTVTLTAANDAPTLSDMGPDAGNISFLAGSASFVALDAGTAALAADEELDSLDAAAGNYNGASVTLARTGGADADDRFGLANGSTAFDNGDTITVSATDIGTVTAGSAASGSITVTFNGNATSALVDSFFQSLGYLNDDGAATGTLSLDITLNDGNAGSQGSGGVLSVTQVVTVSIAAPLGLNQDQGDSGDSGNPSAAEGEAPAPSAVTGDAPPLADQAAAPSSNTFQPPAANTGSVSDGITSAQNAAGGGGGQGQTVQNVNSVSDAVLDAKGEANNAGSQSGGGSGFGAGATSGTANALGDIAPEAGGSEDETTGDGTQGQAPDGADPAPSDAAPADGAAPAPETEGQTPATPGAPGDGTPAPEAPATGTPAAPPTGDPDAAPAAGQQSYWPGSGEPALQGGSGFQGAEGLDAQLAFAAGRFDAEKANLLAAFI